MTRFQTRLLFIVIGYLVVGFVYLLATPPFESSDEYKHYPVVQHIQNTGSLVTLDPADPGNWLQEGAQPPLYYLLMAWLTAPIDTSDFDDIYERNNHAFVGDPNQIRNKNLVFHNPEHERFPSNGSVRAVYVIRIASLLLGVGTVLCAAQLGKMLHTSRSGLLAATLTAFNPMFLFTSAAVNNDSLANLLGAVGILLLVKLWQSYLQPKNRRRQLLILGVVLGLGMLTKLSLAGLLLLTGIALAVRAWQFRRSATLLVDGLIVFVLAMAIVSPMVARNVQTYGATDPTAINIFIEVQGTRNRPITLADWRGEFGTFYRSFWGLFGGVNVAAPNWVYLFFNGVFWLGIAGWVRQFTKIEQKNERGFWLLTIWVSIIFLLLVRWTIISPAFQGRLIFPALTAINVLLSIGLLAWLPKRHADRVVHAAPLLLAVLAVSLALQTIRPAYAFPTQYSQVPAEVAFGPIRFSDATGALNLVGVEMAPNQTVTPGGQAPIEVSLYWELEGQLSSNYLTAINALGRELEVVARVNRHPAWGMLPLTQWQSGDRFRDDYRLFIDPSAVAPNRVLLKVAVFDPVADVELPATGEDGAVIPLVVVGEGRLAAANPVLSQPPAVLDANFAEGITLIGYEMPAVGEIGGTLPLTLTWRASATPSQDYTVFVQLLSNSAELVGSGDAQPINNGEYPTTLWRDGDLIVDRHDIVLDPTLPAGTYKIAVGLYEPTTFARLPLLSGGDALTWSIQLRER